MRRRNDRHLSDRQSGERGRRDRAPFERKIDLMKTNDAQKREKRARNFDGGDSDGGEKKAERRLEV